MRLPRQEYWSGLPFPSPSLDLPDPEIKPVSPALQADSLPLNHLGSPITAYTELQKKRNNFLSCTCRDLREQQAY